MTTQVYVLLACDRFSVGRHDKANAKYTPDSESTLVGDRERAGADAGNNSERSDREKTDHDDAVGTDEYLK